MIVRVEIVKIIRACQGYSLTLGNSCRHHLVPRHRLTLMFFINQKHF